MATSASAVEGTIPRPSITSPPTIKPLQIRDSDRDNTCGYFDGDPDQPFEICDSNQCNCQSTNGVMAYCSLTPSFCRYTSTCYASSELLQYDAEHCDDRVCSVDTDATSCFEDVYTECIKYSWTDISVSAWGCWPTNTVTYLSFSHPIKTDTASSSRSSSRTTSTASRRSSTSSLTSPTSSTITAGVSDYDDGHKLSAGAIAGIALACFALLCLIITFILFLIKRRETMTANQHRSFTILNRPGTTLQDGAPTQSTSEKPTESTPEDPAHVSSPTMQPLPSSAASSTVVLPNLSPGPSPAPRDSGTLPPGGSHMSVPISPFPDQSSIYNAMASGYRPNVPSFTDSMFTGGGHASNSPLATAGLGRQWNGARSSPLSEMDATQAPSQVVGRGRQTMASELMGSLPNTPR